VRFFSQSAPASPSSEHFHARPIRVSAREKRTLLRLIHENYHKDQAPLLAYCSYRWKVVADFMPLPTVQTLSIRWSQALLAGLGGAIAISLIAATTEKAHWPLLMGSLGASSVLVFGFPESPFCRPSHVVTAHVLCTALGLICLKLFGHVWWAQGLSVGLSIFLMLGFKVIHPPAGGNPLLVFAMHADWSFLLWPALFGSLSLVTLAWLWKRRFPKNLACNESVR